MWQAVWDFVKSNSTLLKDAATVLLTAIAVLIAYLTYRRARATLLAPVRTEVIKQQLELIKELLGFLEGYRSFDIGLWYGDSAKASLAKELSRLEMPVQETPRAGETYYITPPPLLDKGYFWDVKNRLFPQMDETRLGPKPFNIWISSTALEVPEEGIEQWVDHVYYIQNVHTTTDFGERFLKIQAYCNHPFMPPSLQKCLSKIVADIRYNVEEAFPLHIHDEMKKVLPKILEAGTLPEYTYQNFGSSVYLKTRTHNSDVKRLLKLIRKFLHIEKEW